MEIPANQILDNIHDAVVTLDTEWRVTYLNQAAARFAGRSVTELLGRSTWEIFPEACGNVFYTELHRAASDGQRRHFEQYCPSIDRWLEADVYPSPGGMTVITRDITAARNQARDGEEQIKRAARELQHKLEQMQVLSGLAEAVSRAQEPAEVYRAALQGLTRAVCADRAGVLIFDGDGVLRFKAWSGLSDEYRAAVTGHTPWTRGAPDAQPIAISDVLEDSSLSVLMPVLEKEGIRALAFIPLMGYGGVIGKFMLYYNQPHEFREEELQIAQTIATHVAFATERRNAEAALQVSEERFRATFFQAAVGITQANLAGELRLVNDRFCEMLGYSRAEMLGKTFLEITHPDYRQACLHAIHELQRGETLSYSTEKRFLHKDGVDRLGESECVAGPGPGGPAAIFHWRGGRHYGADTGGARSKGKRAALDTRSQRGAPGGVELRFAGEDGRVFPRFCRSAGRSSHLRGMLLANSSGGPGSGAVAGARECRGEAQLGGGIPGATGGWETSLGAFARRRRA